MTRRPPGAAKVVSTAVVAFCYLFPLLAAGQQQQQQQSRRNERSPHEGSSIDSYLPWEPSRLPERQLESTHKHLKDTAVISNSASAIATLAPAGLDHAVRAPPARFTGKSAGLSSLLNARSLQDWEVDDLILLATVDGTIHARDRKTGAARWALEVDRPMVETTYHRQNRSGTGHFRPEDDFLWIVEPSRDGNLYIYNPEPDAGLQKLGLTVKKLVEDLSPYAGEDPAVVYTAEKKNTLYTVDAGSGKVLKMFSTGGSSVNDDTSCRRVSGLELLEDEECGSTGTLTLGRTEYTVGIQSRDTGHSLCTIKYSEWGPNNRDSDLHGQYFSTMDKKYVYSRHDGSIFAFDHAQMDRGKALYTQKLSSPVARVFDIVRPLDNEARDTPLVILPQPIGPTDDDDISASLSERDSHIFINTTENGGWYAMSEKTYPLVTGGAAPAHCYSREWLDTLQPWEQTTLSQRKKVLTGVHPIFRYETNTEDFQFPTLSVAEPEQENNTPLRHTPESPPLPSLPTIGSSRLIGSAAENAYDILLVIFVVVLSMFVYVNKKDFAKLLRRRFELRKTFPALEQALLSPPQTPAVLQPPWSQGPSADVLDGEPEPDDGCVTPTESPKAEDPSQDAGMVRLVNSNNEDLDTAIQVEKRPARRGRRGGRRRNGKKNASVSIERDSVDRIVQEVKEIARDLPLQPDVLRVNDAGKDAITDVSQPFQLNNLRVTDTVLGHGSHGTVVYKGSFEGREVAVKRMLLEFFDIASQEVTLLQESDDHPNVIRYFCRQQSPGFLFIALELCPASLQDVVEKPQEFPALAQASLLDLPNVLYQIAAGVRHLHSLKIVHRDLKPQNILVGEPRIPRNNPNALLPPRMLISDFGLCKKLEGDQSSFRATTAHAAGTSGWRAPELLVDEDASPVAPVVTEGALNGDTSEPAVIDSLSNRRATRAIDIFSLGCVFFYILSRGNHPFDDRRMANRYMREANIVKDQYNLDQLDELGDYAYEAKDLIGRMLFHNPLLRPDATKVMIHPFFWSPEKRLNFLCDVSDHFEWEIRDPPSTHLQLLEDTASEVIGTDFLKHLGRDFVDTLGKQRKYTGTKMLDLLRALRNKKNHYQDMPDYVKAHVGALPDGYLHYWTVRFPSLLLQCYYVVVLQLAAPNKPSSLQYWEAVQRGNETDRKNGIPLNTLNMSWPYFHDFMYLHVGPDIGLKVPLVQPPQDIKVSAYVSFCRRIQWLSNKAVTQEECKVAWLALTDLKMNINDPTIKQYWTARTAMAGQAANATRRPEPLSSSEDSDSDIEEISHTRRKRNCLYLETSNVMKDSLRRMDENAEYCVKDREFRSLVRYLKKAFPSIGAYAPKAQNVDDNDDSDYEVPAPKLKRLRDLAPLQSLSHLCETLEEWLEDDEKECVKSRYFCAPVERLSGIEEKKKEKEKKGDGNGQVGRSS
ncbi:MAG: bifunctional endoribonuclease/protein kinase ire1 [Pycnora praestabilis]|nr:MAG: bifunctional endoribonuclease/protein kinase ire1 [Pycnora praestabilis]